MESSGQLYFDFRWTVKAARGQDDPDMLIWWQQGDNGECWSGKRSEMPKDCVEIDPPAGGKSDRLQREAAGEEVA